MRFRVFCIKKPMTIAIGKRSAPGGIRTHGLLSRSQMPYPLGHGRSFLFIIPHSPGKGKPFRNFLPDRELARRKYRLNAIPRIHAHTSIPIQHPVANGLVRENLPRIAPLPYCALQ